MEFTKEKRKIYEIRRKWSQKVYRAWRKENSKIGQRLIEENYSAIRSV